MYYGTREATASRRIAATDRARLHELGQCTQPDDAVENHALLRRPWLLLAVPRPMSMRSTAICDGRVDANEDHATQRANDGADARGRASGRS